MEMRTLVDQIFEDESFKKLKEKEALETLMGKLEKRHTLIEQKLDEEKSQKEIKKLNEKMHVNDMQCNKAKKLLLKLNA